MKRRLFLFACCALLLGVSPFAQSRGAKPDPLSGTWTGQLILPNGPGTIEITMVLKFDGKGAVSGTFTGLPNPGDVKAGTFDPKTGALKLQLGKQGDSSVRIVLDGKVAKGAATGTVSGEGGAGEFKLARKR